MSTTPQSREEPKYGMKTVSKTEYVKVHSYIKKMCGGANHCSSKTCKGKSKIYQWALKHGKKYECNVENFVQLCIKCHKEYDMTDEVRKSLSKFHTGKKMSKEACEKMRQFHLGTVHPWAHKKVKNLTTGEVFGSIDEAWKKYKIYRGTIRVSSNENREIKGNKWKIL